MWFRRKLPELQFDCKRQAFSGILLHISDQDMSFMHSASKSFLACVVAVRWEDSSLLWIVISLETELWLWLHIFNICHNLLLLTSSGNFLNNGPMSYLVHKSNNKSCMFMMLVFFHCERISILFPLFSHCECIHVHPSNCSQSPLPFTLSHSLFPWYLRPFEAISCYL